MNNRITIILDQDLLEKVFEIIKETFISPQNNISQSKMINVLVRMGLMTAEKMDTEQWSEIRECSKNKYLIKGRKKKKSFTHDMPIQTIIDELLKIK